MGKLIHININGDFLELIMKKVSEIFPSSNLTVYMSDLYEYVVAILNFEQFGQSFVKILERIRSFQSVKPSNSIIEVGIQMCLHVQDDNCSSFNSAFDINSFTPITNPVEDEKKKNTVDKVSNEKHYLLIVNNIDLSIGVKVASEVRITVAGKNVIVSGNKRSFTFMDYSINDFDVVETYLMTNLSMDEEDAKAIKNVIKPHAVDWNVVMMKPNKCFIRYQNLLVTGQKVKCILSSITSLQKVKDDINGDDIDVKDVMILFQHRNKNNLRFIVRVASQSKFLHGGDKIFMKFLPFSAKLKYRY